MPKVQITAKVEGWATTTVDLSDDEYKELNEKFLREYGDEGILEYIDLMQDLDIDTIILEEFVRVG